MLKSVVCICMDGRKFYPANYAKTQLFSSIVPILLTASYIILNTGFLIEKIPQ